MITRKTNFFAVDIGASSGRTMLGTLFDNRMEITEITRFSNPLIEINNHFFWDLPYLHTAIIEGLKKVSEQRIEISSIGIDTWGVDFAMFDKNGELLGNPYAYRDPHTFAAMDKYLKINPKKEVYKATGIQIMNFNTLFQFFALNLGDSVAFKNTAKFLFIPDALSYFLTGKMVTEYTIASTSQTLNPFTKKFDEKLLASVGISADKFAPIVMPGTVVGQLSPEICRQTNLNPLPVVAVAGHDTASAIAAIPALDEHFAYLSSGTWSLMGIELKEPVVNEQSYQLNFTNEGGINGTIRYLKNICGMWLLERCRAEWIENYSYNELIEQCDHCTPFQFLINPDDEVFANPENMLQAIYDYCMRVWGNAPSSIGEYVRCIFESLALRYRQVFEMLKTVSPFTIKKLHVIGGGSKNSLLNQFTANSLGIPVIAGPSEATALGNVMVQALANKTVADFTEMRKIVNRSVETVCFNPQNVELWDDAYRKYIEKVN